jgi:5'-nucleotidase
MKHPKFISQIIILFTLLLALQPAPTLAQSDIACESDVIVQADDWLSKLAAKFYNDPLAFPAIAQATNAKAINDNSYATIDNPDLIEIGWKLCLPGQADALALLGQSETVAASDLPDSVVPITLIHLNDVYEITPVSGGKEGGLARVATLRKQLLAENPNTFMLLAGDLFSPSALGTATVNGERLAGQQTVGVMNAIGLDFMTFGNHEFDLNQERFLKRLDESEFAWVSSNVFDANGQPFPGVAKNRIFTVTDDKGQEVRIGLFGLTIGSNPKDYVTYNDPFAAAGEQVAELRNQVDILIGLTHLAVEDDTKLSQQFPEIDLIVGGHEHENMRVEPGPGLAPVFKADANARTAYIHTLLYDTASGELQIASRLQPITDAIPDDPEALQAVNQWTELGFEGFRAGGFNPEQVITQVDIALDGLEASVRNKATELTQLIAQAMLNAAPGTELAIYNGGSIRIDDIIPPGNITEYDVIRILPFGGEIVSVEMAGTLLKQVLDQGRANAGKGGYLQTANVATDGSGNWFIGGEPLDESRTYMVAINDFLLTGNEQGLDYLTPDNPGLKIVAQHGDIRKATIEQLKQIFPQP